MHFKYQQWDERFSKGEYQSPFDSLWDTFQELLTIASGEVSQALQWLNQLDNEYGLTDDFDDYGIGDFIKELEERGYLERNPAQNTLQMTRKTERSLRRRSLEEIFDNLKKGEFGSHQTDHTGRGLERQPETRKWHQGDDITNIDSHSTMMNMLKHSNIEKLELREGDIRVHDTDHYTSVATVLLIDLSHSMILYGEDRITPAKKVAMALSELILNKYAKDSLDIVAFGNEAWKVNIEDLPYLKAGPYHTNTKQALQLARHILHRRKYANKQIFMITDGKPSCIIENGEIYKNSFGLDRKIVNKVLDEAVKCRRDNINITTFMIARDPYLQNFVRELTEANKGRAYFASLDTLGEYLFEDYIQNRKRRFK
ncbi:vWA domain-containing protein [Fodinibius saliphilus]|uniref:vWA domain-containing protein n=1 Tax=Fodinibius saliphilus TaxID=1920650 RepID=UPI00110935B5|nr:VWA domain-containing protein [Fodinibius saliphilus]